MHIYALTGLIALALKAHYSLASARDLGWILAPTALLVGWLRGEPLRFDASHGWVPDSHHFVIAPACAGVNFMILAFCAAVLGFTGRFATTRGRWVWLTAVLVGAYLVTIGVNAIRIVTAVALYDADLHYGWLTAERVHRLAGTVIYLAALSATWLALDRLSGGAAGWRTAAPLPLAAGAAARLRGDDRRGAVAERRLARLRRALRRAWHDRRPAGAGRRALAFEYALGHVITESARHRRVPQRSEGRSRWARR